MRALRFCGWLVASLFLPGLALWRGGHRGAAGVVASTMALPTILAFASLRWPSLAFGVLVGGLVQFLVALIGAIWGPKAASRQPVEKWPTTAIFAAAVLFATITARLWREQWSEPFTVRARR